MARLIHISIAILLSALFMAPTAVQADAVTEGRDLAYLAWVRETIGTNNESNVEPSTNVAIFPEEELTRAGEIEKAYAGSRILVAVFPEELRSRISPRAFAAFILNREWAFDGVIVLSGNDGGFESRFGWSECSSILTESPDENLSDFLISIAKPLNECLLENKPAGWDDMRAELSSQETGDLERKQGVTITEYESPRSASEEAVDLLTSATGLMVLIGGVGLIILRAVRKRQERAKKKDAAES